MEVIETEVYKHHGKSQDGAMSRVRQPIFPIEIFIALRKGAHYHLCSSQVWNEITNSSFNVFDRLLGKKEYPDLLIS